MEKIEQVKEYQEDSQEVIKADFKKRVEQFLNEEMIDKSSGIAIVIFSQRDKLGITSETQCATFGLIEEQIANIYAVETKALVELKRSIKDKIKEVIGRSPDYSDMLMMRMKFLLTPSGFTSSRNSSFSRS